jgi:hypothetical protein
MKLQNSTKNKLNKGEKHIRDGHKKSRREPPRLRPQ